MSNRIEVFYAYALEDEEWVQELDKHLHSLQSQGIISIWHPRLIVAGEDWQRVTDVHFQKASIILLLISPDFLASDYCYGTEMKQALKREREKGVCVIPILLRPVDWKQAPFAHLRPLPSDATFLTEWSNLDRAFAEVTTGIRHAVENLSLLAASLTRADFPSIWNVPFPRNLFFSGREDLLVQLHTQLQQGQTAALSQAISGLGGVGKTQLAVEYAYRFYQDYQTVLWAYAESTEVLVSSYIEIATLLNLPVKESQEQMVIIQAVKIWLQNHQNWLLILDNADKLDILSTFLPPRWGGHVIITTRAAAPGRFAHRLLVETFPQEQGILFLLRRAGLIALNADISEALPQDQALAQQITHEVGGLPLALDQIGAYLETTGSGLASYWQQYQRHRVDLLKDYRGTLIDHSPVATTWSLSLARVEERNPAAADLVRLCAFLAPDAIGEDMLMQGANALTPTLSVVVSDGYLLDQAIEALRAYSLITRDTQAEALVVHRLVQTVVRDSLPTEKQKQWMLHVVALINQAFPDVEFTRWSQCERYLPHALVCAIWIEQEQMIFSGAADLLNRTAYYLDGRARYPKAEPLYRRALAIREQVLGTDHPDTAATLTHLGNLYEKQGRYKESEECYQRALAIDEQVLGVDHPDTAAVLNCLGWLYGKQGRYKEAETCYQRALVIREQVLGADHPDVAATLDNLGYLCWQQGRDKEAETCYQRALATREQVLGTDHPDTAATLKHLGNVYERHGQYKEAVECYQRALAIDEQVLGVDHPDTADVLNYLGWLYGKQGRYKEAETCYQRALVIREQVLGTDHPDVAATLDNLGYLYWQQRRYKEAETCHQRALAINEQMLGTDHLDTATTLHSLGLLYSDQGRYKEAKNCYQRALDIYQQILVSGHVGIGYVLEEYAFLELRRGHMLRAAQIYSQALKAVGIRKAAKDAWEGIRIFARRIFSHKK